MTLGAILVLVTFFAFDSIAVATAMPAIGAELNAQAGYSLAFSTFLAGAVAGQGAAGGWSDIAGAARPLYVGVTLFLAGMVGCALASSFGMLLLCRTLSGVGGGMLMVAIYVLIAQVFADDQRPRVFGWLSAAWLLPALIGPLIAGWLAGTISWRWVFWVGVPFALAAAVALAPVVRGLPAPSIEDRTGIKRRVLRSIVLALAAVGLPWAVQSGAEWWLRAPIGVLSVIALVATLPRLVPVGTLRGASGAPSVVAFRGVVAGAYFGAEAYLPLVLNEERGLTLTQAGLVLTVASFGWSLGAWIQGRDRSTGVQRASLLIRGAAHISIGILVLPVLLLDVVSPWVAVLIWSFAAMGMGLAMATTNVVVMALSPDAEQGRAGAALQLAEGLGSVAGVAIGGAIYALGHGHEANHLVFTTIWLVLAALAALGLPLGVRVRR